MKGIKKFITSTLAMATLAANVTGFAATLPEEIVGTKFEEPVQVLAALNIMVGDDTGALRLNDTIKRSEVAKIVVHAMGLDKLAGNAAGKTVFPDVAENHWASGYITVANSYGLVVGDDTGNFRPDDSITTQEAMTIFVRATGYEPVAGSKGGYPNGYVAVAGDNGLADDVEGALKEGITRGNVAVLANNALTVELMERNGYGEKESYEVTDKTLLENKLKVTKASGQITAIENTSLDGTSNLSDGQVRIGDEVYETAYNINDLLGYNVNFYAKENEDGDNEIILAIPKRNSNQIEEITSDMFEAIGEKNSLKTIEFFKTEDAQKVTTLTLASDAKLIYNGKSETMSDELLSLEGKSGRIRLLDTDRDGKFDIAFVSDYFNMVVEEVTSTNKVVDKFGAPTLKLDREDESISFRIMKGVQEIEVTDLKEYDVLSVAASKDKEVYQIEVSRETIEGKVTGIGTNGYKIGDKSYKLAENFDGTLTNGTEGKFYLDVFGKIAAVEGQTTVDSNYAYLIQAHSDWSGETSLKLFTKEGKEETIKTNNKIRFNGTANTLATEVAETLNEESETTKQLVTYQTNAEGKITVLNTALDNSETGEVNKNKFTLNYKLEDAVFNADLKKLGSVRLNSETVVFDIQEDSEDYAIASIGMFEDEQKYNAMVFDMGEDFTAKAIVVTGAEFMTNAESAIAIVDHVAQATNDDDEAVDRLYAYRDGKKIEINTEVSGILVKNGDEELETGDIIQYKLNADGEIAAIRVLMDIASKDTEQKTEPVEHLETVYGKVVKKFANSINVTVDGGSVENYVLPDEVTVYSVDTGKTKNNITVATKGDIQAFDEDENNRVFIKIYKNVVQEVVIIK